MRYVHQYALLQPLVMPSLLDTHKLSYTSFVNREIARETCFAVPDSRSGG